jgi:hypothetical protein
LARDEKIIIFVNNVRNLGTALDSELSMEHQLGSLRKKMIRDLRKISRIRPYISSDTCQKLVSSLIFSKLDCCNSLLFGIPADKIKKLQVVQNNAARLILNRKRADRATPLLRELHWLPVRVRIDYKAATLVFKCLQGTAPKCIEPLMKLRNPARNLRSSKDSLLLKVPRTKL